MAVAAIPAWVAIAATAASTGLSVYSAVQQGNQQSKIARAQADAASQQAQDALTQGRQQEQNFRMQTSQQKSQKIASMAANGLDTSSGSALNVAGDIASLGETDALRIRDNAYTRANAFGRQSAIYEQSANNLQSSGLLNAGSSLLSGVGSVATKWYNMSGGSGGTRITAPVGSSPNHR